VPDRNGPQSRWSSAREREERDRQRAAAREEAKRARLAREANEASTPPTSDSAQRRLTDDERRTIREYRFPSIADRDKPASPAAATSGTTPPAPEAASPAQAPTSRPTTGTSTRWRDTAPPPPGGSGGGPGLPDLPGDPGGSGGRKRPGNSRLLIFGLGLFALMALIAFLPFGPFAGEDNPTVPTPSATLPSILNPETGDQSDSEATAEADQPVAGAGQPIVCIDPGHGGWDTGWNRTSEGDDPYSSPSVTEAELNLGMAYMLKELLEAEDIFVVMTRPSGAAVNTFDQDINGDGDTRLDADNTEQAGDRDELQARINVCNEAGADILISVHINGVPDRSANGYEIIYTAERDFGEQNEELATLIYRQLDQAMREGSAPGLGRGPKRDTDVENTRHESGSAKHFIMTGPAVEEASIQPSEMPGVIAEASFLSNDGDAAWIVQPANQRLVVEAYARGILEYFENNPPGS
jgi:N-acetylmuramoyl-L-alanine amidase